MALLLFGLRAEANMWRKLVPLVRRHVVQVKVAVVIERTVHRIFASSYATLVDLFGVK